MDTKITYDYIKRLATKNNREVDVKHFLHYLSVVGLCTADEKTGDLVAEDSIVQRIGDMLNPITTGNIALVFNDGMYVVLDVKPAANPDGKHFRGMRVSMDQNGSWKVDTTTRSKVFSIQNALNFATSQFDIQALNEYSYDRYIAYTKIAQLDEKIEAMRG